MFKKYEKYFTVNPPGRSFYERVNGRVSTWEVNDALAFQAEAHYALRDNTESSRKDSVFREELSNFHYAVDNSIFCVA